MQHWLWGHTQEGLPIYTGIPPFFFTNSVLAVTACIFPHIKAVESNARLTAVGACMRIGTLDVDWLATHAFLTVLQSAAYQPLRHGQKTGEAISFTIIQLQSLIKGLEDQEVTGMAPARRIWLSTIARCAFNAHLRTLRC